MLRGLMASVVSLAAVVLVIAAEPAKEKPKGEAAVRAKLTGAWQEFAAGKVPKDHVGVHDGYSWEMFSPVSKDEPPNRTRYTDWDNEAQQWVGELHLNADADPMWLDFKYRDAGRERVRVGIVKFDGDNLRWVQSGDMDANEWAKVKGKVDCRATKFEDEKGKPLGYALVPIKPKK